MSQDEDRRRRTSKSVVLAPRNKAGICRWTPDTLRIIIKQAGYVQSVAHICRCACISRDTLENWLRWSKEGKGGFDVELLGETRRFHEWYEDAVKDCVDAAREAAFDYVVGRAKVQATYRGRPVYMEDPKILEAHPEWAGTHRAILRDELGMPVPEMIFKQDPEMIRWYLESKAPEEFGRHQIIDVNQRGPSVLVVGAKLSRDELRAAYGGEQEVVDIEFEEVDDDTDPADNAGNVKEEVLNEDDDPLFS
jgi:hypothetical protein